MRPAEPRNPWCVRIADEDGEQLMIIHGFASALHAKKWIARNSDDYKGALFQVTRVRVLQHRMGIAD